MPLGDKQSQITERVKGLGAKNKIRGRLNANTENQDTSEHVLAIRERKKNPTRALARVFGGGRRPPLRLCEIIKKVFESF